MTYDHVFQDGSKVFAADLNTLASEVNGKLSKTDADANYAPKVSAVGAYTYDGNGNVTATPDGTTYTWESDGTGGYRVKTETSGGVTRTFTYNTDGTLGSVA